MKGGAISRLDGYGAILQGLQHGADARTELVADTIELHRDLLQAQAKVQIPPCLPALSAAEAATRLAQGHPLLVPEELRVEAESLTKLALEIIAIIGKHRQELLAPLSSISAWLEANQPEVRGLISQCLRDGRVPQGEAAGLDGSLLVFVLNNALRPFLRSAADALSPWLCDSAWYRGWCPVCGGHADLAALEKEGGACRLLCSRCDTEWAFYRGTCPFCSDEAHLSYYSSDDSVYRLYVCEGCKRYLKTIDLRETAGERLLPVERILTIGMDVAAVNAGWLGG